MGPVLHFRTIRLRSRGFRDFSRVSIGSLKCNRGFNRVLDIQWEGAHLRLHLTAARRRQILCSDANSCESFTLGVSGGRSLTPPFATQTPLYRIVARAHMYTCDVKVWYSSLVQEPFSVAPCPNMTIRCVLVRTTNAHIQCTS
jgi:hypothetical protein